MSPCRYLFEKTHVFKLCLVVVNAAVGGGGGAPAYRYRFCLLSARTFVRWCRDSTMFLSNRSTPSVPAGRGVLSRLSRATATCALLPNHRKLSSTTSSAFARLSEWRYAPQKNYRDDLGGDTQLSCLSLHSRQTSTSASINSFLRF